MRTLAVVLVLATTACGGGTNDTSPEQQGEFAFFEVFSVLGTVQQRALGVPSAPLAPAAQVVTYTGPCSNGGSVSMNGTYDGDGTTHATFVFDTTLVACTENTDTLDGALRWTGVENPPISMQTITGAIAYQGAQYAGRFGFDLAVTYDATTNMVTFGGTYTIGGVTYSADSWIPTGL